MEQIKTWANAQTTEINNEQAAQVSNTPAKTMTKAKDGYFIFGSHKEASDYMAKKSVHKRLFKLEEKHWPLSYYFSLMSKKRASYFLDREEPVLLGRTGIYSAPFMETMYFRSLEDCLFGLQILPYYIGEKLYYCVRMPFDRFHHILPEIVVDEYAKSCNLPNKDKLCIAAYYMRRYIRYIAGSHECNNLKTYRFGLDGVTSLVKDPDSDTFIITCFDDSLKFSKRISRSSKTLTAAIDSYIKKTL